MQITVSHKNQNYTLKIPDGQHITAPQLIQAITTSNIPRDIKDALLVRLADEVNMFGKTIKDNINSKAYSQGHLRYSVQVHPYPWQPSGASNVVIYKNVFHELSVVLVYNQRRDRRSLDNSLRALGVPSDWRLPEGYMHPSQDEISIIPADDMDEAEELLLKKIPMTRAYQTIAQKAKRPTHKQATKAGYDKSMQDCAHREVQEEIGLHINNANIHFVTLREENAIVGIYLMRAHSKDLNPPVLKIDGIEIAHAAWGKLKAFQVEKNKINGEIQVFFPYYDESGEEHAVQVPMRYALTISKGIQHFRNMEIQQTTPQFSTSQNIEARIIRILNTPSLNPRNKKITDILGISPEEHFKTLYPGENKDIEKLATLGLYADRYHAKILYFAQAFENISQDILLTADKLMEILIRYHQYTELNKTSFATHRPSLYSQPQFYQSQMVKNIQTHSPLDIASPWQENSQFLTLKK